MEQPWIVWGLDVSLFTGKLEAILRAKGVAYERRNMTQTERLRLAKAVGVEQMPLVERADGSFLSDTTLIHRWLEDHHDGPALSPVDTAARFISRLIEDWADELLWRPAMHWRWKLPESRHVLSGRIADQALADIPVPRWLKKRIIIHRQYGTYVKNDGVRTQAHRDATDQHYLELLDTLEPVFRQRDYVLGDRPTEADFGLFGPFFRHFFCDPLPGPIMQDRAPHVLLWASRLWAITPDAVAAAEPVRKIPGDLGPLLELIKRDYFDYMQANAAAVAAGKKHTCHTLQGVEWKEYSKPFRVWCLNDIKREYTLLETAARDSVAKLLGDAAIRLLEQPPQDVAFAPPALPIAADSRTTPKDSWLR